MACSMCLKLFQTELPRHRRRPSRQRDVQDAATLQQVESQSDAQQPHLGPHNSQHRTTETQM
jgi:hypothetical protein